MAAYSSPHWYPLSCRLRKRPSCKSLEPFQLWLFAFGPGEERFSFHRRVVWLFRNVAVLVFDTLFLLKPFFFCIVLITPVLFLLRVFEPLLALLITACLVIPATLTSYQTTSASHLLTGSEFARSPICWIGQLGMIGPTVSECSTYPTECVKCCFAQGIDCVVTQSACKHLGLLQRSQSHLFEIRMCFPFSLESSCHRMCAVLLCSGHRLCSYPERL